MAVTVGPSEEQHPRDHHDAPQKACCKQQATKNQRKVRKYETYNYDPLPRKRGAIRILKLLPSNPENPEVECELMIHDEPTPYEALSWCWGTDPTEKYINIRQKSKVYRKSVSENLFEALKALRYEDRERHLWVDAVSIDQEDMNEKNHQVEMMYEIYGNAISVCIWLGIPSETSCLALTFIQEEVLELKDFDELCERRDVSKKWHALLELMQRPWFSRRWVVQEIALARKAVVYCGQHSIAWHEFAIAVELFVEVETATHRLSEIMRKDSKDKHVPGLFEYVSALGASLLVDATDRLFRDYKQEHVANRINNEKALRSSSESDTDSDEDSDDEGYAILTPIGSDDPTGISKRRNVPPIPSKNNMRPLLSLEYLVSSLTIFDTSMPHDTIYALLAIAKDTTPKAASRGTYLPGSSDYVREGLEVFTQRKRYNVNYELPYVDVCKEFVEFAIERSLQIDPSRALDVICRPWATEQKLLDIKRFQYEQQEKKRVRAESKEEGRKQRRKPPNASRLPSNGSPATSHEHDLEVQLKKEERRMQDLKLPSWVPQLSAAPYGMYQQAGLPGPRMSRKNADPLVGLPSTTRKVYSAAETKKVDMKALKFRKRADLEHDPKHFSMYIRGFEVDKIEEVEQVSQNGQIPREWTDLVGWRNTQTTAPPEAFWRTLVADRGRDGKNPPVYYSRACAESFKKGGYESGAVNTSDLINYERNSVVSQFCRRVQAVVWNRALVKTKKGRFGLVGKDARKGDRVCILYGLSVPVILRQSDRKEEAVFQRELDWELAYIQKKIRHCFRQYKARKQEHERRKDREMLPLIRNWHAEKKWREHYKSGISAKVISESCNTEKEWNQKLEAAVRELIREGMKAFSKWRSERRAREWGMLFEKGSVGDVNGAKARDAKPKNESNPKAGYGSAQPEYAVVRRGREESTASGAARLPNPSKEKNIPEAKPEDKKAPMDWWGFEHALKAGRRWMRLVKVRKEKMAEELQKTIEHEWAERRKLEYASFLEKRKAENIRQGRDPNQHKHSAMTSVKPPARAQTQAERSFIQKPGKTTDPKDWQKYGVHRARKAAKPLQDTGSGAELHSQDKDIKGAQSSTADHLLKRTNGNPQRPISNSTPMNPSRLSVTESVIEPGSPIHDEPFDFAIADSVPGLEKQEVGADGNTASTPKAAGSGSYDEDQEDPSSHGLALQTSIATLIEYPSGQETGIIESPEDTHASAASSTRPQHPENQIPEAKPPLLQDAPVSSTTSRTKVLQEAPAPEEQVPATYRPSWYPPKKEYDRFDAEEGAKVIVKMKEWLKSDIFKEDGYHSYELLGECYIHGIMDGEAMLYQNEGDEDDQGGGDELRRIPPVTYEIR